MHRRWIPLALLTGLVLLAGGLLSGTLATRCLRPLLRAIENQSDYTLSVNRARLTLNGEVHLTRVVFGKKGAPRTTFSQVKINPRWLSWFKGRFEIESLSVNLGDGTLTGQGTVSRRPFSFNFQGTTDRFPLDLLVGIYRDLPEGSLRNNWPIPEEPRWGEFKERRGRDAGHRNRGATKNSARLGSSRRVDGLRPTPLPNFPCRQPACAGNLASARLESHRRECVSYFLTNPNPIAVAYTGSWRCSGTPMKWNVGADGHLDREVTGESSTPVISCVVDFEGGQGTLALRLARQKSEMKAHVKLDTNKKWMEGDFHLTADPLSSFGALWPELNQTQGTVVATGHWVGPWDTPGGTLELNGNGLHYKNTDVKKLQARLDRRGSRDQPFVLSVRGSSITWINAEGKTGGLAQADMEWKGTTQRGELSWTVQGNKGTSLKGQGPAHRKGQGLSWSWKTLNLIFPSGDTYASVPGGTVDLLSAEELDVRNFRVGDEGQTLIVRRFSLNKGTLAVEAAAKQFNFVVPGTPLAGRLTGEIFLHGPWDRPEGHFELSVTSASYGNLTDISAEAKGQVTKGLVSVDDAKIATASFPGLRARGTLPWAWVIASDFSQPMDIGFETGRLDPVDLLKNVPNAKGAPGGTLTLSGRVFGPKDSFSVEGTIAGFLPHLELPSYGIIASDTHIDIELKDRHLRVRKAETKMGKGRVRVSGESHLPSLNVEIEGTKVSLLIRRQLELLGDFHLELGGTLPAPNLKGALAIAQGTYERAKKKKKEEVVGSDWNGAFKKGWDSLKLNVQAEWSNNVWYRDGLTKIETRGDLEVVKEAGDSMPGVRGLISLLKGNYDAYGRDFVLKTGELTFTDPSEIDPQLNVHATHKMKNYLIDLTVLGTAKKPDLQFQSTPPLQEQDILALLALGKVPGQSASQGSTSSEKTPSEAAELAADVVSNYLTREIRSAGMNVLDLDVVRVSPSEKGNEWTVGRYWGSKLFLSYSYTPEDAANQVLKAEYSLTPRWTFVGQTGSQTDNYLDLTFRLPVGKSRRPKK